MSWRYWRHCGEVTSVSCSSNTLGTLLFSRGPPASHSDFGNLLAFGGQEKVVIVLQFTEIFFPPPTYIVNPMMPDVCAGEEPVDNDPMVECVCVCVVELLSLPHLSSNELILVPTCRSWRYSPAFVLMLSDLKVNT